MTFRNHNATVFVGGEDSTREEGKIAGYQKIKTDPVSYLVDFGTDNRWVSDEGIFDTQYVDPNAEEEDDA